MRLKLLLLLSALSVIANVRADSNDADAESFLFIQDICGVDARLMDTAQSVFANYMPLLKNTNKIFLGTNNPDWATVKAIASLDALAKAMSDNRAAWVKCKTPSIGATNVAHVTTISVDANKGSYLNKLSSDYELVMETVGITEKNAYFENPEAFAIFPGEFQQTYDPQVALLDLVNAFGSDTQPVTPPADSTHRCIKDLQAVFAFHTDISSAQQVIENVTKYFSVPDGNNIDYDEDTCEYDKYQEKDKTLFSGTMYCNVSAIGQANFCSSNMATYSGTISTADFKQAPQVNLQAVVDTYTKTYSTDMKMKCHCFDYANPDTTQIILWTPLSPTSLDTAPVSFDGFNKGGANFKHIVMPFGFNFKDSPLWNRLVPEDQWLTDASQANYAVDQIIQDIWTITCRLAGKIEDKQTAEPVNPYTTRKPRVGGSKHRDMQNRRAH